MNQFKFIRRKLSVHYSVSRDIAYEQHKSLIKFAILGKFRLILNYIQIFFYMRNSFIQLFIQITQKEFLKKN